MNLQNKNKLFLDSFCNSLYKSNSQFKKNKILKKNYQLEYFKYKNLNFLSRIFLLKKNKNIYSYKFSFVKPLKFYDKDKIYILKNLISLNSKKIKFFSNSKIFDAANKKTKLQFNNFPLNKTSSFNFNFLKSLIKNNDLFFKIIQLLPIFKHYLIHDFKVYLNYEFFFMIKSQFNQNPLSFKPSFVLNQKINNLFFLKSKNLLFYKIKKQKNNFCKLQNLFYKIKSLEFLQKNQNSKFVFSKKIQSNNVKFKNNKLFLLNPFLSNFYKKNQKILKKFEKEKFILTFQEICFIIEMIFFLAKNRFYKKRKKISFQIQKFLWSHLIFKKESFIPLLSLMFEHKYNEHKLKKNQILFLNFNKFLFVKNKVDFQKTTQNNYKYNVNRDKISKINFFTKQHPEIEMILGLIKFALFFELSSNISSINLFKFFIKKSNYTIKKNEMFYDYFKFLFQTNFKNKSFLLIEFLNKKKILFKLKAKKYLISNNSNFFYILNKLIKISQLNPKYYYHLPMYKQIFQKILKQNFSYRIKNEIKQNFKCIIQHIWFDGLGLKTKIERKISNHKLGLVIWDVNKLKKFKNIRFYYNSFQIYLNIKFYLSFYNKILNFCKEKDFSFFKDQKNQVLLISTKEKSIFFVYKNFLVYNLFLLYNFKSFFFNSSFFLIYKTFEILTIQNQYKFFFLKKWDPLKQHMFLFLLETIWRNVKTTFSLLNLYKNFSLIYFENQFHKILVIEKANLFFINNKHIFICQFVSFFILWIKKMEVFLQKRKFKFSVKKINFFYKNRKNFLFTFYIKGFILFVIKNPQKNLINFHDFALLLLLLRKPPVFEQPEVFEEEEEKNNVFFKEEQNFFIYLKKSKEEKSIIVFKIVKKPSFLAKTRIYQFIQLTEEKQKQENSFQQIKNEIQFFEYLYSKNETQFFLIPSKIALKTYLQKLKQILMKSNTKTQRQIINELNLKIIHWSFYNRIVNDFKIFIFCDTILFRLIWKWCCQKHPNKSKEWIQKKYFFCLKNKKWIFGVIPQNFDSEKSMKRIYYLLFHHFLNKVH